MPRGQRVGGPPTPKGITTIGMGVVIKGEVKGARTVTAFTIMKLHTEAVVRAVAC